MNDDVEALLHAAIHGHISAMDHAESAVETASRAGWISPVRVRGRIRYELTAEGRRAYEVGCHEVAEGSVQP